MIRTLCSKLLPLGASKGLLPFEAQTAKGIQAPLLPTQGKETRRTFFSSVERDQDWAHLEGYDNVEFLTDQTIDLAINQSNSMLLMFYAPWCVHCKNSRPEFAKAAAQLAYMKPDAKFAAINSIKYTTVNDKYMISGFPTIRYCYQGKMLGDYHHRRRAAEIVDFMLREPKSRNEL